MTEETVSFDYFSTKYNNNHNVSNCDDVILEAKRVILNEQLDKITNYALSQFENPANIPDTFPRECRKHLDLRDDSFWQDVPYPGNAKNRIINNKHDIKIEMLLGENLQLDTMEVNTEPEPNFSNHNKFILQKYFSIWKNAILSRKTKRQTLEEKIDQKLKLDSLIKKMKKHKKKIGSHHKNVEEIIQNNSNTQISVSKVKSPINYMNRFKAQKSIIHMQKTKLDEQNKLIDELKLGIIREDLLKSIESSKVNIREIFANCSQKVKAAAPITLIDDVPRFDLKTQKAPKIVQQMEERALQRAQNRQTILERKRLIEEARQKILEEAIERKRVLEEEDRKKNLEAIKERRKKELETERIRQANKQKYLENLDKAIRFHRKLVLSQTFHKLYTNLQKFKEKNQLAQKHYDNKVLKKSYTSWLLFIENLYKPKFDIAVAHYNYKLLKHYFDTWKLRHMESFRNLQVAEDYHDFRLTSNTFIHWHRYVCRELMAQESQMKIVQRHYERRILFQYFYQWRSLKAVLELEKAKELKKRKWREKVWEILPNYQPPDVLDCI